jgi:hypothetical protein
MDRPGHESRIAGRSSALPWRGALSTVTANTESAAPSHELLIDLAVLDFAPERIGTSSLSRLELHQSSRDTDPRDIVFSTLAEALKLRRSTL